MKSLFKCSKKIFISMIVFALLVTSGLCFVISNNKARLHKAFAAEQNYNFTSYDSSTGYPYKVSNFTISDSSTTAKHGVINIDSNTYSKNYEKYGLEKDDSNIKKYQDSDDNYVLMINSNDEPRTLGYTSSELSFEKNGHYRVSINVLTDNVASSSTLYLFNGNEVFAKISNINTQGNWQRYFFYFSTNDYEDIKLKIGLWQGSKEYPAKSYVLFDSVKTGEISASDLNDVLKDTNLDGKTNFVDSNVYYKDLSGDNVLESVEMDFNTMPFKTGENNNNSEGVYSYLDGKQVFTIRNSVASNNSYEGPEFVMLPNKVYKFSIKARIGSLSSGSAYIKLVEVVEDGETGTDSGALTFSSTTNNYDNDFIEYSVIANSDSLSERTVKLVIGLGESTSSQAKGEVYFKDYTISSVPYSAYSSYDSSTAITVNYTDEGTTNDIPNYRFDLSEAQEISGADEIKLNKPTNWTYSTKTGQTVGVFNIKYFDMLNREGLTNFVNPGINDKLQKTSNNVMMLHNEIAGVLNCYSGSFTLSANSYYSITVYAKTTITNGNDSVANIKLVDQEKDDMVIGSVLNISTNGEWKEYEILIKTGYEDVDASLMLSLGSSSLNSNGYVFFDQCKLKESSATDFDNYDSETDVDVTRFDLTKPLSLFDENGTPTYFTSNSANGSSSSISKIVNINETNSLKQYLTDEDITALQTNEYEDKNALLVSVLNGNYDLYKLTTKLNYDLTQDTKYVLSVDVFTAYLSTDDEENDATALLSLSDIENSVFTKVDTDGKWTTYSFYITPTADVTTELVLGLGTESVKSSGVAIFTNISFEEATDDTDFNELSKNNPNSLVVGEVASDEEEEDSHDHDEDEDINWTLLVSTLTAVALIIAVFGVGFKKLMKPGKKRVKKSKVEYDRSSTVMRQKYRKLAFLKRDKDIRVIEKKVALLNEDKLDKESKYKELLSKVRQVKLANRNGKLDKELTTLNKDLNHASKNVSKIGVQVNKLNAEIAYMRTEGYLADLEKRLAKQDELAKSKGSSIEEILKAEDIDIEKVEIEKDENLTSAISKADDIIAEEEKLEKERLEQIRLEEERAEAERLENERLAQEKAEAERKAQEEKERLAKEQTNQDAHNEETSVSSETNIQSVDESQELKADETTESVQEDSSSQESIESSTENDSQSSNEEDKKTDSENN